MKKRIVSYLLPAVALGTFAFLMVAYNTAFTPTPVQKQKVILYQFKENVSKQQIEQHLTDFKLMKRQVPEIVGYSAGYTYDLNNDQSKFDVMHYLTFKTDEDVAAYMNSEEFKAFKETHQAIWEDVLVISSEIK